MTRYAPSERSFRSDELDARRIGVVLELGDAGRTQVLPEREEKRVERSARSVLARSAAVEQILLYRSKPRVAARHEEKSHHGDAAGFGIGR